MADIDDEAVAALLGRPALGAFTVAVRRPDGTPAVIENAPLLNDGRPMPTRYWLVDARLREAVSRLEAAGGVRRASAAVSDEAVAEAHARHAAERDRALPPGHSGPAPTGGVGGTRRGVKCLHAHLAWFLAGGDDPVGRWTAEQLAVDVADFDVEAAEVQDRPGPVAAVDCGTNSTRLIVVAPDGTVLEREMRITRLGEQVDATRRLSGAAIERTATVLREFKGSMDRYGVARARLVATSAVRDAENAEEFMTLAEEITGVHSEVLSGDEEGFLSFAGATAHLDPLLTGAGPLLVVDIGGGSTELAVGRPGAQGDGRVLHVATRSLDIGCVRVSERFRHDPPSSEDMAVARRAVTEEVASARAELPPPAPDGLVIGLAGTVSTLARLDRGITVYDRDQVHLAMLSRYDVERWLDILAAEDALARLARPGMTEGREDVIVGGVLVLAVVMATFGRDRCLVSEDDILDGLAMGLLPPAGNAR